MMTMPRSRPTLKSRKGASLRVMEELAKEPVEEVVVRPSEQPSFDKVHSEPNTEKGRDEASHQTAADEKPVFAKFSVLQKSSQKAGTQHDAANLCLEGDKADGLGWTSQGHPMQWLILDFANPVELCGIKINVPGTIGDPKDLTIQSGQTPEGPWVPIKRFCIPSGPRQKTKEHAVSFDGGGKYQYYRLLVMRNWGAGSCVNICAPLQFQQVVGSERVDEDVRQKLSGMVTHFCEATMLSDEDRAFREFVRERNIDLVSAEEIRYQFEKFDADGSGSIEYGEFKHVLKSLLQAKSVSDIPDNRCKHFWNEVDSDNSGMVSLEEFVLWFHTLFYADNLKNNPTREKSRHNSNNRGSMVERFYSQYGAGRCGPLMQEIRRKTLALENFGTKSPLDPIQEPDSKAATIGGAGSRKSMGGALRGGLRESVIKIATNPLAKTI
jgi:hypothetical protein